MKTESEKIEISKQAAEIVGRPAWKKDHDLLEVKNTWTLLVDNHGACAEIAADRRIQVLPHPFYEYVIVAWYIGDLDASKRLAHKENYADFPSRIEATNWAICEAVIAQNKESGK